MPILQISNPVGLVMCRLNQIWVLCPAKDVVYATTIVIITSTIIFIIYRVSKNFFFFLHIFSHKKTK